MSSHSDSPLTKRLRSSKLGEPDDPPTTATPVPNQPTPQQQKYKCPQCPSSFKRPENLKRHERGHDDSKRFMCSICGKSFARSDILGRHAAVHVRRNISDNNHRKRACRECAQARERCSRGEPCQRCMAKALCCIYPEESRFKISMPHTWHTSASTSGLGERDIGSLSPQSPMRTHYTGPGRETPLQDGRSSQREMKDFSDSDRRSFVLPHRNFHPSRSSRSDTGFASLLDYDGASARKEELYLEYPKNISTNDAKLPTSDCRSREIPGAYLQTPNIGPSSNQPSLHHPSLSLESQDHPLLRRALDSRRLDTLFHAHSSAHKTFTSAPHQLPSDFSGNPERYEAMADVEFDQDPFYCPQPRLVNLKAYELIATTFAEDKDRILPFGAAATSQDQSRHDLLLRLYFEYFRYRVDDDYDDGLEKVEFGGFGAGLVA
ncbi:hypothetical protein HD806DRAFT_489108 [Xylariaceae sp. AK1471]|nr:hypothetical protein HD806DRAFT_489108 [Xylariaceae sp. AK1471]